MIQVWFFMRHALWITAFVIAGPATTQVFAESLLAQQSQPPPPIFSITQSPPAAAAKQSPQATPAQTPPSELANLEAKVRPSVIWVTAFDAKGNLLRTETGFFISADGRFITTAHAIDGGV